MIVPQFLRFYGGYTASSVFEEWAVTFFSLVNSMYRLESKEMLEAITTTSVAINGDQNGVVKELDKGSRGIHGIVQEVRNIKNG